MSVIFIETNKTLDVLDNEIKEHQQQMFELKSIIEEKKKKRKRLELILWDNCEHKWELDNTEYDADCKQYCVKCKLWKNRLFYV